MELLILNKCCASFNWKFNFYVFPLQAQGKYGPFSALNSCVYPGQAKHYKFEFNELLTWKIISQENQPIKLRVLKI
jgi:hypothetical protein